MTDIFLERREYPRFELKKKLIGTIKAGLKGEIANISLTGVLIELTTPLKVRSKCSLKIDLEGNEFAAQGEVERIFVHSLEEESIIYRAGIQFKEISDNNLKILKEYLKRLSQSGAKEKK